MATPVALWRAVAGCGGLWRAVALQSWPTRKSLQPRRLGHGGDLTICSSGSQNITLAVFFEGGALAENIRLLLCQAKAIGFHMQI